MTERLSESIQHYLRSLIAQAGNEHWRHVESFSSTGYATSSEAIATLAMVLAVSLALGAWRIERREYVLTS